jgi:hypothetical protein
MIEIELAPTWKLYAEERHSNERYNILMRKNEKLPPLSILLFFF